MLGIQTSFLFRFRNVMDKTFYAQRLRIIFGLFFILSAFASINFYLEASANKNSLRYDPSQNYRILAEQKTKQILYYFETLKSELELVNRKPILANALKDFNQSIISLGNQRTLAGAALEKTVLSPAQVAQFKKSQYQTFFDAYVPHLTSLLDNEHLQHLMLISPQGYIVYSDQTPGDVGSHIQNKPGFTSLFEQAKRAGVSFDGHYFFSQITDQDLILGYSVFIPNPASLTSLLERKQKDIAITLQQTDVHSNNDIISSQFEFMSNPWTILITPKQYEETIGFYALDTSKPFIVCSLMTLLSALCFFFVPKSPAASSPLSQSITLELGSEHIAPDSTPHWQIEELHQLKQTIQKSLQLSKQTLIVAKQTEVISNDNPTSQDTQLAMFDKASHVTNEGEELILKSLDKTKLANQHHAHIANTAVHMEDTLLLIEYCTQELQTLTQKADKPIQSQVDKLQRTLLALKEQLKQLQQHTNQSTHAIHESKRAINKLKLYFKQIAQVMKDPQTIASLSNQQFTQQNSMMQKEQLIDSANALIESANQAMQMVEQLANA